jgi:hypothetical protein
VAAVLEAARRGSSYWRLDSEERYETLPRSWRSNAREATRDASFIGENDPPTKRAPRKPRDLVIGKWPVEGF